MKTYSELMSEATDCEGFYSFRSLNQQSADFLHEWMLENKIPNPVPKDKLHTTVLCTEVNVPGYTLDPTLIMVNPASYKFEMLDRALVISFKCDPLEEQWQKAMNLGAKSKYPKFIAHVSLSYMVPESFDYEDLKPPPTFLILDPEQKRPIINGWADAVNEADLTGDVISDQPNIYVPQNTLNISRHEMPQISDHHKMAFIDFLENNGITVQFLDMPVSVLRSAQDSIDMKKVERMPDDAKDKPIIISKENFVVDGHHRWISILNSDPHKTIPAYRIDLPIQRCFDYIHSWRDSNLHKVSTTKNSR